MNKRDPIRSSVLLSVARALSPIQSPRSEEAHEILRRGAAELMPVDACYVAFWNSSRQTLDFAYNYDDLRRFNDPIILPLGTGPTSWVVRSGKTLVHPGPGNDDPHHRGVPFGNPANRTESAIHAPIHATLPDGSRFIGVFSVQAYQEQCYRAEDVSLVEWMASQLGVLAEREYAAANVLLMRETHQEDDREREAARRALQERFERMLEAIRRDGEKAFFALPADDPSLVPLTEAMYQLRRTFYAVQVELGQMFLPHVGAKAAAEPDVTEDAGAALGKLTNRECDVLRLLPTEMTYKEIAATLGVTINTVKFHCRHLFEKLGVSTRHEAVRWLGSHRLDD